MILSIQIFDEGTWSIKSASISLTIQLVSQIHLVHSSLLTGHVRALPGRKQTELPCVSDKEMAPLLNQSIATLHRQAKAGRLDAPTSERLLLLARLANYGATVFQDQGKFTRWLRRPLRLLGEHSPLGLLDSFTGVQLIEDILDRIEYGVFS